VLDDQKGETHRDGFFEVIFTVVTAQHTPDVENGGVGRRPHVPIGVDHIPHKNKIFPHPQQSRITAVVMMIWTAPVSMATNPDDIDSSDRPRHPKKNKTRSRFSVYFAKSSATSKSTPRVDVDEFGGGDPLHVLIATALRRDSRRSR
jgi:hypothetical protein